MIITSFANPKVKYIRKLEQKKHRQQTGQFFIEGLRTVGEAVQTGAPIQMLVTAPDLLVSDFGKSLLYHPGVLDIDQIEVSAEIYTKLAHKDGPQGIGAIVDQRWIPLDTATLQPADLWITLDSVADPGNLGTIMRTADAVGACGIILLGDSTDPYDPAAVKASMGSLFTMNLIQTGWDDFLFWQQTHQIALVGTSDSAEKDYQQLSYQRPMILLMGSERHGLSAEKQTACDQMACIPMEGRCDSLNLAVATSLMLYEIYNQSRGLDIIES